MNRWWVIALGVAVLLGGAACAGGGDGGGSAQSSAGPGIQPASAEAQQAPDQPAGVKLCEIGEANERNESGESQGQEAGETKIPCITVDVTDSAISLSAPLVNQGPLELIVNNTGSVEHTVVISGPIQGNTGPIPPGATARMRGRIAAGDYQIYSVKNDQKETGLEAALKVQ